MHLSSARLITIIDGRFRYFLLGALLFLSFSAAAAPLRGVNLAGAEFNAGKAGARLGTDYIYPSIAEMDYYSGRGLSVIRIPFDIDRLQPTRSGPLSAFELAQLDEVVAYAATKNLKVILDPHNYGYMQDAQGVSRAIGLDPLMPGALLADFWSKLAMHFKLQSLVYFGLMNEPHDQTPAQWQAVAELCVNAIRATGATQKILIPGTSWSGAYSWVTSGNAAAWAGFKDPNFAYELHQYLDRDNSGTAAVCASGVGASSLIAFAEWARPQGVQAFIGETGWSTDVSCNAEAVHLLNFITSNSDVYLGYTYWAGGPWMVDSIFSIEPYHVGQLRQVERAQMSVLLAH